jgi:peroxiredoxin
MVAILSIAALTLAGCGINAQQPETSQESTGAAKEPTATDTGQTNPAATGDEAANFTATTLAGEEFDLSEKRGEVVALYFMAGWCGSCIPEAQSWSRLYPAYKDKGLNLLVVSVDPNDTPQTIEAFRRAGSIGGLPWAIDRTGEFTRSLGVRALDSTIIVDREGRIAYRDAVPTGRQTLERELEEVL